MHTISLSLTGSALHIPGSLIHEKPFHPGTERQDKKSLSFSTLTQSLPLCNRASVRWPSFPLYHFRLTEYWCCLPEDRKQTTPVTDSDPRDAHLSHLPSLRPADRLRGQWFFLLTVCELCRFWLNAGHKIKLCLFGAPLAKYTLTHDVHRLDNHLLPWAHHC